MHEELVNRLGGLSLPRKSVFKLTDRPDMTLDVYRGRKTTMQQRLPNVFQTSMAFGTRWVVVVQTSLLGKDNLVENKMITRLKQDKNLESILKKNPPKYPFLLPCSHNDVTQ